jgi:alcohol dehydrogenase
MLAMVEAGKLRPGKIVSRTVGLDEVNDVFHAMASYDARGVVVIDRF